MKTLIDIIIPVYNVGQYLDNFFSSLKRQTVQSFNMLVVYDKSDDNSLEVIESYEKEFNGRLTIIINQERNGLANARNVALDSGLIESKYLMFLDPDDEVENVFIEKMLESIESNQSDIAICGFKRIDLDTNRVISTDMVNNPPVIDSPSKCPKCIYFNTAVWNKIYRRELFDDLRFDIIKRFEDVSYFIRTFIRAKKVSFINEPLYIYSVRTTSLSQSFGAKHLKPIMGAIKKSINQDIEVKNNYDFICGVLFIRLCIGTSYRIYSHNPKEFKGAQKEVKSFMNSTFPKWNRTKYISMRLPMKNGEKSIAICLLKHLYVGGLSKPFFKWYTNRSKKKGIETHW